MKIGGNGNSAILSGTSSPDGVVSAPKGTLYVNTATGSVWQNTDGVMSWSVFGQQQIPWAAERYYFTPNATATATTTPSNEVLRLVPQYIPNRITIVGIGLEVTAAGQSGSKIRLGIYADDGTGRPSSLVVDAGTINGDSATQQEITGLATMVNPGWYWIASCVQAAPSSQPTIRTNANGSWVPPIEAFVSPPSSVTWGMAQTGVSGPFPSTLTLDARLTVAARVFLKT